MRVLRKPFALLFLILFLASCFLQSCDGFAIGTDRTIKLDALKVEETMYASSIFKNVQTVILESSTVLLANIVRIQRCRDYFYILDSTHNLYVFDVEGRYRHRIGGVGGGLGEYDYPSDFAIDPVHNYMYLLECSVQAIYQYDLLTGSFVGSIKLDDEDYRSYNVQFCDGKLYTDLYPKKDGRYLLRRVNPQNGATEQYYLDADRDNKGGRQLQESSPFYPASHGGFYFIPMFSNTVFQVDDQLVTPYLTLKSKNLITKDLVKKMNVGANSGAVHNDVVTSGKIYQISQCLSWDKNFFFRYLSGDAIHLVLADVNTLKSSQKVNMLLDDLVFDKSFDSYLLPHFLLSDSQGAYSCVSQGELS